MALRIRMLGDLELLRDGVRLELPPSKKARLLLGYLVLTRRAHRRDRLCSMLWDVADDPRGALRWTLSRLRQGLGDALVADRDEVRFDEDGVDVDWLAIRALGAADGAQTDRLEHAAAQFRGELLEGLDASEHHELAAWLAAEREDARRAHARILTVLRERLREQPARVLPYVRALVHVEPSKVSMHVDLVRTLTAAGRPREAEEQRETALRLLAHLGAHAIHPLVALAGELRSARIEPAPAAVEEPPPSRVTSFVGRREELAQLITLQEQVLHKRRARVCVVTGEPGIGKTRLLNELMLRARVRHGTVLHGAAFEAERAVPYRPWLEALQPLDVLDEAAETSRERLYQKVAVALEERAREAPPVLVVLDDAHWLDDASTALLHAMFRALADAPVLFVLAARAGELAEHAALRAVVRDLRRDRQLDELALPPIAEDELRLLVASINPRADADRIVKESAGNALFAVELSRAAPRERGELPETVRASIRERVDSLDARAREVLRWGAIIGRAFDVELLRALEIAEPAPLLDALEILETHGLLRADGTRYDFTHDVVRRAVHDALSEPRRRLMHARIATVLSARGDHRAATDVARHAVLGGDPALATRASLEAGMFCLRVFASEEAVGWARRGLTAAEDLPEQDRVGAAIALHRVMFAARRPDDPAEAVRRLSELAERALDFGDAHHARLGFITVSWLLWEDGAFDDAELLLDRLEQIGRTADEDARVRAIAEAGHCLAVLERDLPRAEALLLEANALSHRRALSLSTIPMGLGLLRAHRGEYDDAIRLLGDARSVARAAGDRLSEFEALAALVLVEYARGNEARASAASADLMTLGERAREGSEAPFARALAAALAHARGEVHELDNALRTLRAADAKHRTAIVLLLAAEIDEARGALDAADARASEALRLGTLLDRTSETTRARVILARVAEARGEVERARGLREELARLPLSGLSAPARAAVLAMRAT